MRVALVSHGARVRGALGTRIERLVAVAAPGSTAYRTAAPGETASLVHRALAAGAKRIVVAGGDGTVHEAANALFGTQAEFAVIPAGSGNDYARSLGTPVDIEAAVAFAIAQTALPTDAGEIVCTDGNGSSVRRIFVNMAEAGFGASVVTHSRTTVRFAPPWLAYQAAILAALVTLRSNALTLSADGQPASRFSSTNLIVALGQYFGAGLRPLPDARLDDGLFDVAHIRDASRLDIARHAPMLKNGIPPGHPKVDRFRCRTLHLASPARVPVEADGELVGSLPATLRVLPAGLQVVRKPSAA